MIFTYPDGTSETARSLRRLSDVRCECCRELPALAPPAHDLNGAWLCAECRVDAYAQCASCAVEIKNADYQRDGYCPECRAECAAAD